MSYPPIILFTYNRPKHTKHTLDALSKNKDVEKYPLYIFSDAPKKDTDIKDVQDVRTLIKNLDGFNIQKIIERENNLGLAKSIETGVTDVINKHGRAIVLEDDLITSPFFLPFMRDSLMVYKDNPKVMHINGYCPPTNFESDELNNSSFFYRLTWSWGWATWKDRWNKYENNSSVLFKIINENDLLRYFDIDGSFRFSSTLRSNIRGDINTWAIKWYSSIVINNGLCLSPFHSLVRNIGNDNSGEHSKRSSIYDSTLYEHPITVLEIPVQETPKIQQEIRRYYKSIQPSIPEKLLLRINNLIKKS